jgi:hypothetical protein
VFSVHQPTFTRNFPATDADSLPSHGIELPCTSIQSNGKMHTTAATRALFNRLNNTEVRQPEQLTPIDSHLLDPTDASTSLLQPFNYQATTLDLQLASTSLNNNQG